MLGWGSASSPGGELGEPGSDASLPGGNIGPDPRQCGKLDGANLFCVGPLQHPTQNRKAGAQKQALPLTTLRVLSPHAKQVRPIEPAWHQRLRLSTRWAGRAAESGLRWHRQVPSIQWLIKWVEADLTGAGLAPLGPSSQWLGGRSKDAGPRLPTASSCDTHRAYRVSPAVFHSGDPPLRTPAPTTPRGASPVPVYPVCAARKGVAESCGRAEGLWTTPTWADCGVAEKFTLERRTGTREAWGLEGGARVDQYWGPSGTGARADEGRPGWSMC
ncbi:hypothetical protein GCM10010483_29420 [Actinokineospora diospyrosa]